MQDGQTASMLAGVTGPGWHRGGETSVWRGGHVVQAGLWALFRPEVDQRHRLELVALVEAGESGWTWEVTLVDAYRLGAKTALAAMDGAVAQLEAGAGQGSDERRALALLRRWSAGTARAAA